MRLLKTSQYTRNERKFFKKHSNLIDKYSAVLKLLQKDPFANKLKTHKLTGKLNQYYSCSISYKYRIILTIKLVDEKIILMNIGAHDEVY